MGLDNIKNTVEQNLDKVKEAVELGLTRLREAINDKAGRTLSATSTLPRLRRHQRYRLTKFLRSWRQVSLFSRFAVISGCGLGNIPTVLQGLSSHQRGSKALENPSVRIRLKYSASTGSLQDGPSL